MNTKYGSIWINLMVPEITSEHYSERTIIETNSPEHLMSVRQLRIFLARFYSK